MLGVAACGYKELALFSLAAQMLRNSGAIRRRGVITYLSGTWSESCPQHSA
jgi:hypothetical protein